MDKKISEIHRERFNNVINVDYLQLSKKTDKFRLDVDLKKVRSYLDLQNFYNDYYEYLSYLGKTQIEMIIKDVNWNKTVYAILAANKFKKLINK